MGESSGSGAALSDFDADGINNLLEYAFFTNPLEKSAGPFFSLEVSNRVQFFPESIKIRYQRWVGGTQLGVGRYIVADLDYQLETFDEGNWVPISYPITQTTVNQDPNGRTEEVEHLSLIHI